MAFSVADGMGQIGLVRPLLSLKLGQSLGVRLEADDLGQTLPYQRTIRRRAVDRVGADIDHFDAAVEAEDLR